MTFGDNVANRRRELGISQKVLAEELGISASALCKIERNKYNPSKNLLRKIQVILFTDEPNDIANAYGNETLTLEMIEKRVEEVISELLQIRVMIHDLKKL